MDEGCVALATYAMPVLQKGLLSVISFVAEHFQSFGFRSHNIIFVSRLKGSETAREIFLGP